MFESMLPEGETFRGRVYARDGYLNEQNLDREAHGRIPSARRHPEPWLVGKPPSRPPRDPE